VKAVLAGTFDPFTSGHCDLVRRARALFDGVIVAVARDTGKSAAPLDKRLEIARKSVKGVSGVDVVPFSGLLAEFLKTQMPCVLVRGLRGVRDFEYERDLCRIYGKGCGVECVYMMSAPENEHVSSTVVRSIAELGGALDGYVEPEALSEVAALYRRNAE